MRPYLRAANVGWSGLLLNDVKEMNFTDEEMSIYRLEPDDIVLGEASGSPDEVGKPAMWAGQIADCAFQNTLLRVRSHAAEPKYLLYFFRHLALSQAFARRSRGVGIHHIGRAALASWPVPLPPVGEQRRIVETLEDNLSRLDAAETLLDRAARRVQAMEASSLSSAASGPEASLGDVAEIQGGIQKQPKRKPGENAYPFLRVANVTAQGLDLSEVHTIELFGSELERLRLREGDLLVVEGNGSPSQIGRAAVWDGSIQDCVHQNHLIRVRPKPGLLPAYLEAVWNSPKSRRNLTDVASSTSGLYTLSVAKLARLRLPVPPLEEQQSRIRQVADIRVGVRRLRDDMTTGARKAQQLRRAVLAAAFSGQLSGSRLAPIEEVARV
jgi:type I restriction enzyme S subunit